MLYALNWMNNYCILYIKFIKFIICDLREANKKFVKIDEYRAKAIEEEEHCFKAEKYVKRLEKKS